jgi:hypothetical protein
MAMALVLLVGAGLMIRSLANLWNVSPSFNPHNAVNFAFSHPTTLGSTPQAIRAAMRQLRAPRSRARRTGCLALRGLDAYVWRLRPPFWIEGQPKPTTTSEMKQALFYAVDPGYLQAAISDVRPYRDNCPGGL